MELCAALLKSLDREYRDLLEQPGAQESILRRFQERSPMARGRRVPVEENGGFEGVTEGLDPRGFLQVRTADGFADGFKRDGEIEVRRTGSLSRCVHRQFQSVLTMLLVLDVGNTNTVLGVFAQAARDRRRPSRSTYEHLVANWRVATIATQTVDEYGVLFRNLFAMDKIEVKSVHGIIISSVVPPLDSTLRQVCERYFNTKPLFIEPGVKTGMPVLYDNPAEVGADRIVNSVAAFEKFGGPCIVVDFGTATTFDCVTARANTRAA